MAEEKKTELKPELQTAQKEEQTAVPPVSAEATPIQPQKHALEFHWRWQGPLPHPKDLERYAKIPGVVEYILAAAKREQEHRHEIDRQLIALQERGFLQAQRSAFWLFLAVLVCTTFLAYADRYLAAGMVGSGGLASIIFAFLKNRPFIKEEPRQAPKGEEDAQGQR